MQFSKPRKLVNAANPGGRYMISTMFDARELLGGSSFDRITAAAAQQRGHAADNFVRHDQLSYISPDRSFNMNNMGMSLPVPIGYFMPPMMGTQFAAPSMGAPAGMGRTAAAPPSSYQQRSTKTTKPPRFNNNPMQAGMMMSQGTHGSQNTQDGMLQFSQGPLTQPMLSMSQPFQMSQPGFSGLSQIELSQDSYLPDEFKSQADGLLSQDSTYQGDRMFGHSQGGMGFLSQY